MTPIEFPQQTMILAKDQPQYRPLPVFYNAHTPRGEMVSCWKLTFIERLKVLFTGKIWCQQLTFHNPLQPQLLSVDKLFK